MSRPRIVVVGSFNADLTAYTERLPRPGETVAGRRFVTGPGGKGSNQAVAAARLGADVVFVGRIGTDVFAPLALALWREEGIDTRFVVQDERVATGVAPILVDAAGENSIVVVLGANLELCRADLDAAAEAIGAADVLLTQLETSLEATSYALELGREHGTTTILNPAPAAAVPREVLARADYLTPNETELQVLAGGEGKVTPAARSLLVRDDQAVVVTRGKQGAQWVGRDLDVLVPSYSVQAVDTTGAGDAFNGALAVALAEGREMRAAIAFANAAAALSVTKAGTAPSMPRRDEVERLVASS